MKDKEIENWDTFYATYDEMNGEPILVQNNLVPDEYLSLTEFKERCWKKFLIDHVSYQPSDDSENEKLDVFVLKSGLKELKVDIFRYPEIHKFFQNANRIYSCYQRGDGLPKDIPLDEQKCFLDVLSSDAVTIAKAHALRDAFSPHIKYYSSFDIKDEIQNNIILGACLGVVSLLCFVPATVNGVLPIWGTILLLVATTALPNAFPFAKFCYRFLKNVSAINFCLDQYKIMYLPRFHRAEKEAQEKQQKAFELQSMKVKQDDSLAKENEEKQQDVPLFPAISSFQEICASLEKLPDSVQKRELVEQTKDFLNRYQNAIGDISSLEQESERQSQRIKIESAFNNRLVLLRQDILNADQQQRDDIDSIQQLQTLNEQLTAMLLESDDTDVTRKGTNQPKVLRKSASAGQHH